MVAAELHPPGPVAGIERRDHRPMPGASPAPDARDLLP